MILILSGTQDAREIIDLLLEKSYPLIITTATSYGASLISQHPLCEVIAKKCNQHEIEEIIKDRKVKLLIDATHPYATEVSKNAMNACEHSNIFYFRYQRNESELDDYKGFIQYVIDYEEAAEKLKDIKGNILLTTGSKTLETFAKKLDPNRLFPRVLPTSDVILKCEKLNILPSNIIAMQGPFSIDMNLEIIKKYNIEVIVTKESGTIGGTLEKIEAAKSSKSQILMIKRPSLNYKNRYNNINELIEKVGEVYA
ncbi:cobalt-precorrin-6A reductase [Lutibacter sp. B2]|nr:cobalt-precorrin-6A reductase [Lutibacter sp. B2]